MGSGTGGAMRRERRTGGPVRCGLTGGAWQGEGEGPSDRQDAWPTEAGGGRHGVAACAGS
jgi:hypothetical protein